MDIRRILKLFVSGGRPERMNLRDLLAEPVDPSLAAFPIRLKVPWIADLWGSLLFFPSMVMILGVFRFAAGVEFDRRAIALIVVAFVAALAMLAWKVPRTIRSLAISGEGLRVERVTSTEIMHWSMIRAVFSAKDGSSMCVVSNSGSRNLALGVADRKQLRAMFRAARAQLAPFGVDLREWQGGSLTRFRGTQYLAAVPGALLTVAFLFVLPQFAGSSLGMRCSGPSTYLQDRFNQPHRPGCIVLGVTGASKRAGLQQGDMVISLNGAPITGGSQFGQRYNKEGNTLHLEVVRAGGDPFEVNVKFGSGGKIKIPQEDPIYYLEAGLSSNDDDERIELFTRAIALAPDFDYAYLRRGEAYYFVGAFQLAMVDFAKVTEFNPDFGEPDRWRSWVQLDSGLTDAALTSVERAIALDGCDTAFIEYNVDCHDDYDALQAIYQASGDPRAQDANAQRVKFYPRGAD